MQDSPIPPLPIRHGDINVTTLQQPSHFRRWHTRCAVGTPSPRARRRSLTRRKAPRRRRFRLMAAALQLPEETAAWRRANSGGGPARPRRAPAAAPPKRPATPMSSRRPAKVGRGQPSPARHKPRRLLRRYSVVRARHYPRAYLPAWRRAEPRATEWSNDDAMWGGGSATPLLLIRGCSPGGSATSAQPALRTASGDHSRGSWI